MVWTYLNIYKNPIFYLLIWIWAYGLALILKIGKPSLAAFGMTIYNILANTKYTPAEKVDMVMGIIFKALNYVADLSILASKTDPDIKPIEKL
jgi:hypothetical protein